MNDELGYDPKLKQAMEEVKQVLTKYDIGGYVALVSPSHSEFLLAISPLWSCAHLHPGGVRFKATEADYGSKESRDEAVTLTLHLILQIRDLGGQAFSFGDQMEKQLSKLLQIEHKSYSNFRPHREGDT